MIDPEHPDRTACPMMLGRGAPEETGGCIGEKCAAFRWVLFDPESGGYWMTSSYPTSKAAGLAALSENDTRQALEQKPLEKRSVCGMVYSL